MPEHSPPSSPPPAPLPAAHITPRARTRSLLPWLIPLAALLVAGALVYQAMAARGPRITLLFADGHGIKPSDPILHRGVQIGRVREVGVDLVQGRVRLVAELSRDAAALAKSGCFWIVHPQVSISHISGLETLLGPRYLAAAALPPGAASAQAREEPPPPADASGVPGGEGLVVNIRAPRAGSISPGSPVNFRETPVGSVLAVALSEDGRGVLISAAIRPEHAHLVRAGSKFWNVSGIGLDLRLLGGLKLKAESLQTIFAGGLAFATPDKPPPGSPVASGHEFELMPFDEDFLKWSPDLSPRSEPSRRGAETQKRSE